MKHPRVFEDRPAVREQVPLLVGLFGPSGSGKTYSALRLATGIQSVNGGEIYVIDTESRRALHYADRFKFRHMDFGAPFGSLDYLAALQHCVAKGAGVVVVDSMSHEHEGPGGYLFTHAAELDRMAGDDYRKRDRMNFAGWIKPASQRRQLINGLLQLNASFVFCFRAKQKVKPVKGGEPLELGWMPIAGEEFLFEQTVNCLLLPSSGGVPTWQPERPGERMMIKLPEQFRTLFADNRPLDEQIGRALAEWAKGGTVQNTAGTASPAAAPRLLTVAHEKAELGMPAFKAWWSKLKPAQQEYLADREQDLLEKAKAADLAFLDEDLPEDGEMYAGAEVEG